MKCVKFMLKVALVFSFSGIIGGTIILAADELQNSESLLNEFLPKKEFIEELNVLSRMGLLNVAIDFVQEHRAHKSLILARDVTVQNQMAAGLVELGAEGFVIYKSAYIFGEKVRGLKYDDKLDEFAKSVVKRKDALHWFKNYISAYTTFHELHRFIYQNDGDTDRASAELADTQPNSTYFEIYKKAYEFGRNTRRLRYESDLNIFASKMATQDPMVFAKYQSFYNDAVDLPTKNKTVTIDSVLYSLTYETDRHNLALSASSKYEDLISAISLGQKSCEQALIGTP